MGLGKIGLTFVTVPVEGPPELVDLGDDLEEVVERGEGPVIGGDGVEILRESLGDWLGMMGYRIDKGMYGGLWSVWYPETETRAGGRRRKVCCSK